MMKPNGPDPFLPCDLLFLALALAAAAFLIAIGVL